jgi:Protein of unknown function (DUF3307)
VTSTASPGDVFAALLAAHQAGDYWLQSDAQATRKGLPGREGRLACARHVTVMTGAKAAALTALHLSGRRVSPGWAAVALAADAASHYWADRRAPLRSLAERAGKGRLYALGSPREGHDDNPCLGSGAALLDQAWHVAWLYAAALAATGKGKG